MSRIGRAPISIPTGVDLTVDGAHVSVKGPKGNLSRSIHADMIVAREEGTVLVHRPTESRMHRALHGLTRTLIANMVTGVTEGFAKTLEVYGVGYRGQKQGNRLVLALGYSHPFEIQPPSGMEVTDLQTFSATQANEWLSTRFTIRGIDKEALGQFAAEIRALRPPEPYKGKGVRYLGEKVRRKAGKAAGKGGK
ncbi:MAG: 50S ribosomal protein L6 [Chloroflexota bacterium]|nr:MAG: 50S ribosomal protein L6 [Chloroflexota bacterium]